MNFINKSGEAVHQQVGGALLLSAAQSPQEAFAKRLGGARVDISMPGVPAAISQLIIASNQSFIKFL